MVKKTVLYWSRRDLRLEDNPALQGAVKIAQEKGAYFLPLFILENYMLDATPSEQFGYPSRYFLSKAIPNFADNFEHCVLLKGNAVQVFKSLVDQIGGEVVICVNDDIHPDFYRQVEKIKKLGLHIIIFEDALSIPKNTLTQTGNIYSIFTPFKKAVWQKFLTQKVLPKVDLKDLNYSVDKKIKSLEINSEKIWKLFSKERKLTIVVDNKKQIVDIGEHITFLPQLDGWYFSEKDAQAIFHNFLKSESLEKYIDKRNAVAEEGTSKMSLAVTWGLVSSRWLRKEIQEFLDSDLLDFEDIHVHAGAASYVSELIWREFYKYLLYHFPNLLNLEFQNKYRNLKWDNDKDAEQKFVAWIKGETGYPLVDAAMRQLAHTGWMHNRTRMVVASFLTKHLGIDWRWGQEYFRAMLIDLDDASNNGGWQWGASVGADPKPIRIFNPSIQAEKFDPENSYIKRWLGDKHSIEPIVDHKTARSEALKRYKVNGEDEKQHPWEREYSEKKLVTLGTEPSEDAKRFLKWLKKEKFELKGKLVLDAGCGNGKNAFYCAEQGARIVGYDVAKNAVALAQKRAAEEGWKNEQVHFFIHNMSQPLPQIESESVDVILDVTSSNALTSTEREVYLQECFRILRKGGYMFVRTLCKDRDENAKYLIKNHPGPEKDMYQLLGTDIVERAFTREDVLNTYKPYAEVKFLERIFHYPTFEGRTYKRAYWILYLQK